MKDKEQTKVAEKLYNELNKKHIEVIYDDREERPGVKFKDMDLIGIPLRLTVGKKIKENQVELKYRHNGKQEDISLDDIVNNIVEYIKDGLK